ncbi:signal peptidase I SipW [Bacillus infantis]|uniref:Signal peptidase I n=1 Tax=Bacillus infantis TaxID=324767 RepID=A0A5D4RIG6_9BACI|nr:signal peptidase I [Bacillus infantis]MCK6208149.1 signal peptidase I [Bacillus infantis]OXT15040.1 signal peptidase I [Bacillus sp. OG2]TYS51087.1 signal peptidase I [Bacillus infantis]
MKFSWKTVRKIISSIITWLLFINLILMAFLVISSKASGGEPQAFGYQIKTVLSGSMEPTFMTGSVIAVKPLEGDAKKELKKGDIITFIDEDKKLITHRITGITTSGEHVMYETKGDNNQSKDLDPVLSDNVTAIYTGYTLPYAGYFIDFAKSQKGAAILLIGPGILMLGYAAFTIYQAMRELEARAKGKGDTTEKTA